MTLLICPECGRDKVSDSAVSCPSCGFAIKEHFDIPSILKSIEGNLDEIQLQCAAYWYQHAAFKEYYDRNGHVGGIPVSALSVVTPIDVHYEPVDLVINRAGDALVSFGRLEDGQERYDKFIAGLIDLMSQGKYCGAIHLWQTFYWVHVIKNINLEVLNQKMLFHIATITNIVLAPVWKKFAYDTLHPFIQPANNEALLDAFEVSNYEQFETEYDVDEMYKDWLRCKEQNVKYTWDMMSAYSTVPEEISEAESMTAQACGGETQGKSEELDDKTKTCFKCGDIQHKTPRKPNFFKMLIKYDESFTGEFNWICLSVMGVLILDILAARTLDVGGFAWLIALVFVAALFLGVPFALYITYLDYQIAMHSYKQCAYEQE